MLILSKLYRKLKKFNSFTFVNKIFHIKVYIITGVFRACILYFPFNKLKNYMGNKNEESKRNITKNEYNEAVRIAMTIKRVVKYTPWESKCLVQSLTAQYFLNKKLLKP